jgi:uncharacterized membrane protein YfcA
MLDPAALLLAGVAMALAQVVKAVTGFGSRLVAMPVLLMVLPPAEAILVMVVTDLCSGAWLVWGARHDIDWRLVAFLVLCSLPGQWLGAQMLHVLDTEVVKRILGVIVLAMGVRFALVPIVVGRGEWTALPAGRRDVWVWAAVASLVSGWMAGLVGPGGPPIVAFFRRYFEPRFMRAQLFAFFAICAVTLAVVLLASGASPRALGVVPWLLLPLVLGIRVGVWLCHRVSRVQFGRVTGIVLAGAGAALIV